MKIEKKLCPHCNATMVEYSHTLSKGLMRAIWKIYVSGGGPINLKDVKPPLTRNEWDNFQKLRYWDIVEQVSVNGKTKKGIWGITNKGKAFVTGHLAIPSKVWTYRGQFLKYEGSPVLIEDVTDGYKFKENYADEANITNRS